jgi:hypothetical protein
MNAIANIPIDVLKEAGLSNADLDYIRESSAAYRKKWKSEVAKMTELPSDMRDQIVSMTCSSFETRLTVGIAKARNITKVTKKFGFV